MTRREQRQKRSSAKPSQKTGKVDPSAHRVNSGAEASESRVSPGEPLAELERRVSSRIQELEERLRERLPPDPDDLIKLEEGHVVNVEELERNLWERFSMLAGAVRELQEEQKRLTSEMGELAKRIKEGELLGAAREMEVKNFKQTLDARVDELERLVKRQTGSKRIGSRLVSFLADIGKKN